MSWHIHAGHFIAHLNPLLTNSWASLDGYPVQNINNLEATDPFMTDGSGAGGNMVIEFDRAATNIANLDSALILNNDMTGPGHAWTIEAADNSGFSTNLTTLINSDATKTQNIWFPFAANKQRYIRLEWERASGDGFQIGCLSIGRAFQVAAQGPQIATERLGNRTIRTFKNITRANAETIMEDYTRRYIPNDSAAGLDGVGAWGGRYPIALIDDSTSPDTVHWGPARVSVRGFAANYSELIVDMAPVRQGVLE